MSYQSKELAAAMSRLPLVEAENLLVDDLNCAGDALAQYTYLLEAGASLPRMSDAVKASCVTVEGCQSQVWLKASSHGGALRIEADSDSSIVRGFQSLFILLLDGRPCEEVASAELTFLARTELKHALSPSRVNGLRHILRTIKEAACEGDPPRAASSESA